MPAKASLPAGKVRRAATNCTSPSPTCFRLFAHWVRRADSRADWTAGSNIPTRIPAIAITTSSSTIVDRRVPPARAAAEKHTRPGCRAAPSRHLLGSQSIPPSGQSAPPAAPMQ